MSDSEDDDVSSDPMDHTVNTMTWGQFVKAAWPHGVEVREIAMPKDGEMAIRRGKYLYRKNGGKQLWYPLPSDYAPEALVGPFRFFAIIRALDLEHVKHFKGWPIIL